MFAYLGYHYSVLLPCTYIRLKPDEPSERFVMAYGHRKFVEKLQFRILPSDSLLILSENGIPFRLGRNGMVEELLQCGTCHTLLSSKDAQCYMCDVNAWKRQHYDEEFPILSSVTVV